ncbi:hypothetical protein ES703_59052 [subsurface metagenome]
MYWQRRYIKEDQAFIGTSGLETIDLPNKGLLSCIELNLAVLGGAAANKPNVWIHDALEKLELIVNGSQVVKSLTGSQVLALSMYDKTFAEAQPPRQYENTTCYEKFLINLGRFYHDEDFMLDLSKVNDPELRLTFNWGMTGHNGWDGGQAFGDTIAPKYSCIPHLLRESEIIPKGFIKTSEIYRFTSGALKKENMTIPRGPLYNGLYLESRYKWEGLGRNLDYVEVNINNSELIPFRLANQEFITQLIRRYGLFERSEILKVTDKNDYPAPLEEGSVYESNYNAQDVIGCHGPMWGGYCNIQCRKISDYTAQAVAHQRWLHFKGILPFNLAKIPYMDEMDERTWIDSSALGDFWVRYEETAGGGNGATIKLLADEVVRQ